MSRRIPVAVIGCGHLGTFHARLYREMPEAELRAVMDIVPEKARALGESLDVFWTDRFEAAIAEAEAVSIATPTTTHREVAGRCLESGRPVLVEKPIAQTSEEAEALVRLARERNLVLAVGHVERFNPAFRGARPALVSPRFVESHRLAPFVPRSLDIDVVFDLMIHDIDLTLTLIQDPIEDLDAVGVPVLTPGEDIANARIRFANGAVANLTASRVSREKVRKIRFFGPRHYHSLDLMAGKVERVLLEEEGAASHPASSGGPLAAAVEAARLPVTPEEFERAPRPADFTDARGSSPREEAGKSGRALEAYLASQRLRLTYGELPVAAGNALEEELRDFLRAVSGDPLQGASGEAGLRSLEVAEKIRARVRRSLLRLGLAPPPA
jgi:predicted dehydrogenase